MAGGLGKTRYCTVLYKLQAANHNQEGCSLVTDAINQNFEASNSVISGSSPVNQRV